MQCKQYFRVTFSRLFFLLITIYGLHSFDYVYADNFALIIGVSGDTSRSAKANSELFHDFLQGIGNWKITKLIEREATKERLLSELMKLQDTWKDDWVIIHITAHGFTSSDEKYHFFQLYDKAIPTVSLFEKYINKIESEQVIVILEVCFSGVFSNAYLNDGKWILTSSNKGEITHTTLIPIWQKEFSGNIFTKYLIKAFKNSKNDSLQKVFKQAQQGTSSFWKNWAKRINAAVWEKTLKWQTPQIYPANKDLSLSFSVNGRVEVSNFLKDCFEFKIASTSGIEKLKRISSNDILRAFGKPKNKNYGKYFVYDGLEIHLANNSTYIIIENNRYKMKKGLNIGINKKRVTELFGNPHEVRMYKDGSGMIYYSKKGNMESSYIEFLIDDKSDKIVRIILKS